MADFDMSKIWLGKDGYYRDLNGNVIALKGLPISGAAWRYLANKYGREVANRTSMNTRNGNIFLNGRWRFNDVKSSKEGRTATWEEANSRIEENAKAAGGKKTTYGYVQQNPFDNRNTYLNLDTKNKAVLTYKAKLKSLPQAENSDKFSWSDLNPFKEGAWKGNWDNAVKNFNDSFSSIPKIWDESTSRESQILKDSLNHSDVIGPKRHYTAEYLGEAVGGFSRAANAFLGGTLGTALQLVLPLKVENEAGRLGQYLDLGKDLNTIRSYLNPGEKRILPSDPRNKGFVDPHFDWTGIDTHLRQNINDAANFVTAIFGAKGMKGGVSRLKSGVSEMVRDGVGTTLKNNWKPIMSHTPGTANLYLAGSAFNSARKAFAPKSLGGAEGIGSRSMNAGKAAFTGLVASDPAMVLFPYAHSSYIINLSNNN